MNQLLQHHCRPMVRRTIMKKMSYDWMRLPFSTITSRDTNSISKHRRDRNQMASELVDFESERPLEF